MNYRNKTLFGLRHGKCAIYISPKIDYEVALEKVNRILRFFQAPEIREGVKIKRYISLYRKNFSSSTGWTMNIEQPSHASYISLDEAIDLIFDTPEIKHGPTVANLRAGRCAVAWDGIASLGLVALLAVAFPEDCISCLGYMPGPITNDPENDGEWDHDIDFKGPIYTVADFEGSLREEINDITESPKTHKQRQSKLNPEYFLQRDSHTGTQLAETISDFDEQVKRVVRQLLLE